MRKTLLIFSLIAAFSMGAHAQQRNFRIGAKIGPTFDWASAGSVNTENKGVKLGFNVGLVADYYFSEHFGISSGADLDLLRMKYQFTDHRYVEGFLNEVDVPVTRQLRATVVEIPLKAKARFDMMESLKGYVEIGAGLGINCKDMGKDSYEYYWVESEGKNYEDCTNYYRPLQFSMIFGLGAEYEINNNIGAFAQLSFHHAFSNAFAGWKQKETGVILRNNFIGVEVGIVH